MSSNAVLSETVSACRVLVVDDEEAILFAMQEYLGAFNFVVDCARQRHEAEVLLAGRRYSVLIADLRLDSFDSADGLELLAFVKGCSPHTRVIVLTAYGSPEVESLARKLGARAFLHKPRPLAEVATLVRQLAAEGP